MATFQNKATLSYNGVRTSSNIVSGEVIDTLAITKTAVEQSYTGGSVLTYVLSLINSGTTPYTDLTVSDDLGLYEFGDMKLVPLDYVAGSVLYYVNGVLQATPTVTSDDGLEITGITVPAGGNATIIYGATVNGYAPLSSGSVVSNTATAQNETIAPITATETVSVDDGAILSIGKAVTPSVVPENGQLTYAFVISNTGNSATTEEGNAVVSDTFDPILSGITVMLDGVMLSEGTGYTYDETTGEFSTGDGVISVPAATFTQDETTGVWTATPGTTTLTVTGTV